VRGVVGGKGGKRGKKRWGGGGRGRMGANYDINQRGTGIMEFGPVHLPLWPPSSMACLPPTKN
jgi:hypothetical protein